MSHKYQPTAIVAVVISAILLLLFLATSTSGADQPPSRVYWAGEDSLNLWCAGFVPPSEPPVIGKSETALSYLGSALWTAALDMRVYDTAMFVLTMNGLQIFNVADMAAPTLVGQIPLSRCSPYNLIQLDGHYLYVGGSNHLYVFDVTDPFNPQMLSETILEGLLWEIQVSGNRAYVGVGRYSSETSGSAAFYILDVTDPSHPVTIGKYISPLGHQDCRLFAIVGDYVYAANDWESKVEIINIADETRPQYVGALNVKYPMDIAYQDGYLYVDKYYDTLCIYNLANPVAPQLESSLFISYTKVIDFHNGRLFALCATPSSDSGIVRMYDVPSPGQLTSAATISCRLPQWSMGFEGNQLMVPEAVGGFTIYDIAAPTSLTKIAVYSYTNYDLLGLATYGDYAYAINYMSYIGVPHRNGINVVNIADKQHPQFVKRVDIPGNAHNAYVSGQLLFASESQPTFVYSLGDPANPTKISQFPPEWYQTKHNVVRDTILFTCGSSYFWTGNIARPATPTVIDSIRVEHFYPYGTMLVGDLAYVAGFDIDTHFPFSTYLATYDISNPRDIKVLDILPLDDCEWSFPEQMDKRGEYLYLANMSCGIDVIDVGGPTTPDVAFRFSTQGEYCNDVKIRRNYLLAACRASLQVYDLDDPVHPELIQYVPLASSPQRIVVDADYLYVSARWGFYIYQLNLPPVACGDADANGMVNISDAVYVIMYIFSGGPAPDPLAAGDADCNGMCNITDVVYLISYIFSGGAPPCAGCK